MVRPAIATYRHAMREPQPESGQPPAGPPAPPAPPGVSEPGAQPDPSDPGPPIPVVLGDHLVGDLGNARVDARLLSAILLRDGKVARWLRTHGVDLAEVERDFPNTSW